MTFQLFVRTQEYQSLSEIRPVPLRLEDDRVSRLLIGIYPTDDSLSDAKPWQRALRKLKKGNQATAPESVQGVDQAWDASMRKDETVKTCN